MATVKLNGVDRVLKSMKKMFGDLKANRALQKEMGDLIVTRIKFQARRGRPMRGIGKNDGVFPELTDFTQAARQFLAAFNNLHPAFRKNRNRSNVTVTGELVDAVSFRTKNPRSGILEVFVAARPAGKLFIPKDTSSFAQVFSKKELPKMIGVWKVLNENRNNRLNTQRAYKALLQLDDDYAFLNVNSKVAKSINVLVRRKLRKLIRERGF